MKTFSKLALLAVFCAGLGACATNPPPASDPTPPKQRLDAKTDLEYGKAPRRRAVQ